MRLPACHSVVHPCGPDLAHPGALVCGWARPVVWRPGLFRAAAHPGRSRGPGQRDRHELDPVQPGAHPGPDPRRLYLHPAGPDLVFYGQWHLVPCGHRYAVHDSGQICARQVPRASPYQHGRGHTLHTMSRWDERFSCSGVLHHTIRVLPHRIPTRLRTDRLSQGSGNVHPVAGFFLERERFVAPSLWQPWKS
jgi:hypothetical protein